MSDSINERFEQQISGKPGFRYAVKPDPIESFDTDRDVLVALAQTPKDDRMLRALLTIIRKDREVATAFAAGGRDDGFGEYANRDHAAGGCLALMLLEDRIYRAWNEAHGIMKGN